MKRCLVLIVAAAGILMLVPACEESSEPEIPEVVAYQVPGCGSGLGKRATVDSCFSYVFRDELIIEFCVSGNCCPDSNRFVIEQSINDDTITVWVTDTAEHLCRCICTYRIHVELRDLHEDSYQVICRRTDSPDQVVLYSERVYRTQ